MAWINGKSGTYNISTNNSAISGYVKWEEQYDVVANKSLVKQTAYLHRTNIYSGATYFYGGTVIRTAFFGSEPIVHTAVADMSIPGNTSTSGGAYVQVFTASMEIPHNTDGTKSITLGFSMSNNVTGVAGESFTVPKTTATVSLTAIARATEPKLSVTAATMGGTINIALSPADSSFKHKIRYEFGSLVSQIEGIKVGGVQITADYIPSGAVTFTPPTSLGNQIPNDLNGKANLIVYTYRSDGTHIGTNSVQLTLNIPMYSVKIDSFTLTGNKLLNGQYVQNKSTVTVETNASSSYGAGIKTYATVVEGRTYTSNKFTSSALSVGVDKTITVTVTDTRGKQATATSDKFTVYAYAAPKITEFTLSRRADGTTVDAVVKGIVSPVNNQNTKTVEVTLNRVTKSVTPGSYEFESKLTFEGINTDSTFVGTAKLIDGITKATQDAVLTTVAVTMDFHESGKGIAIGKVSEKENLLDIAWDVKIGGALQFGNPEKAMSELSYKGQNPITRASEDTLDFWAAQGNLATAFFSDKTVDLVKPSIWGYLLHIASTPGNKEFHQLWLEQSNGSIHHRGANASAINPWRKLLDSVNCPDYVIERGTSDGWEYTKWNSGKMELFGEKSLSFPEGTKQGDFPLYRSIVSLNLSGLLTKIMSGTCCIQTNGMVPQVCRHSSNLSTAEIVIVTSRTFSAFSITAPIYIIGKWK